MTSLNPIASPASTARMPVDARRGTTGVATAAVVQAAQPRDGGIAAQVEAKVSGGALSADQASSLKDFFATEGSGTSTGSLMRTASAQLDQFDRVLEKLRANLSGGATYGGGGAAGSSGLVVDRLA